MRRELEEAAKVLGERIRTSEATSEDCFELGAILLRKKLYTQATKNLERAIKLWDGAPEELAQARTPLCAPASHPTKSAALVCTPPERRARQAGAGGAPDACGQGAVRAA